MMTERMVSGKFWVLAFIVSFAAAQDVSQAYAFSSKRAEASKGSATSSKNDSLVWITRKDGATSCGVNEGQTLEDGAAELQRNGVKVLSSRKSNDGKMHALSCGMPTGSLNAYQISRADLPKVLTLGFQEESQQR